MKRILTIAFALIASVPLVALAQQPVAPGQTLDRIVAIVGNHPILASQIEEEIVQLQAQGRPVPTDSAGRAQLRRQVLNEMIEEELLVQQAQRDTTVKITEQEVLDQVEQTYQNVRKQFNSETEFREQLRAARFGTVEEWRRWLAETQRRTLYARRLIESQRQKGKLRAIPPTDQQMHDFWEQNKAAQQKRPATVSFRQLVIRPRPDSASKARARRLADSVLVELRHGADFPAAAKRFSGDSVSAAQGGELGWFRRGVMVKEFEDVAFLLRPGEISNIVETPFGLHIIKLERQQPAEILARHILFVPEISDAQVEVARQRAESVYAIIKSRNGAPFDSLAKLYADPQEPKLAEQAPIAQMPPEYQETLARDSTLGFKFVTATTTDSWRKKFVILDVTARAGEGELNYEEVKSQIRQTLGEQNAVRHYLAQLKKQAYIDIRL
jgi:peptidyl-prolyl cis-trans isomerase SurA